MRKVCGRSTSICGQSVQTGDSQHLTIRTNTPQSLLFLCKETSAGIVNFHVVVPPSQQQINEGRHYRQFGQRRVQTEIGTWVRAGLASHIQHNPNEPCEP